MLQLSDPDYVRAHVHPLEIRHLLAVLGYRAGRTVLRHQHWQILIWHIWFIGYEHRYFLGKFKLRSLASMVVAVVSNGSGKPRKENEKEDANLFLIRDGLGISGG